MTPNFELQHHVGNNANIRGFSIRFAKDLAKKVCQKQFAIEFLIGQSIRVPLVSVRYFCFIKYVPLADLGGARPARAPPKGPNSFVLTYKIFKT